MTRGEAIDAVTDVVPDASVDILADLHPNDVIVVRLPERSVPHDHLLSLRDALARLLPEGVKAAVIGHHAEVTVFHNVMTITEGTR